MMRLIQELTYYMGRLPTEDEVLDFINGTDEERLEILRRAHDDPK